MPKKMYVMQYTTHEGKVVMSICANPVEHARHQETHKGNENFKFWEIDRLGVNVTENRD